MPRKRLFTLLWLGVPTAFALALTTHQGPAPLPGALAQDARPAYIKRGDQVEGRYLSYVKTLERYHGRLRAALEKEAPELAKKLDPEPQKPVAYGYQILPKLVADGPRPAQQPRPTSTAYSWRRTERFIEAELAKLAAFEEQLRASPGRAVYDRLIADYKQLTTDQKLIDQHLQYNRFWQRAIAEDRRRVDRQTRFHDIVVEREAILSRLKDSALPPEKRTELAAREKTLLREIQEEAGRVWPPAYLRLQHLKPRLSVIRVPVYTDIQDADFLRRAKKAVEAAWRLRDAGEEFRVEVDFRVLRPETLYRPDPPPARGAHLDIDKHVGRFPTDGGVLTTGANSTRAVSGRYIALGPAEIPRNVLAHEFGHILGFGDGYFRGYRDLGEEGYEVLEIVSDPADIMAAPGRGKVLRLHFEKLLASH